jgi:hypothetical protein
MEDGMRLVGWYWKQTKMHYQKDVTQWFYDDEKSEHVHKHLGVMCMNDYGDLFLIGE